MKRITFAAALLALTSAAHAGPELEASAGFLAGILDQRHHASRPPAQIRRRKPKEMSSLGAPSHIDADHNDCGAVGAVRASP
ncbi:hypothetical protein [Bradyrhizobium retamae]|uniref:hypothetical protein n=1 Tax=Bradyrhizobium retamae TaxID=1300035 RepID=UPI0012E3563C|nr:hypothetical protein [Bradyrhizobium retamae]